MGYKSPEMEDTIAGWTKDKNRKAMDLHSWGSWRALTQESDQIFNGHKLGIFETSSDSDDLTSEDGPPVASSGRRIRQPRRLRIPAKLSMVTLPKIFSLRPDGRPYTRL